MSTDASSSPRGGSILTRKTGPLVNWMWMALLLLVALVYSMWKRNRAAAVAPVDTGSVDTAPGDQTPPPVFILPQNPQPTVPINITIPPGRPVTGPPYPPVGGRPTPPPQPPPGPQPPPKPTAPSYDAIKVDKWVSGHVVWNSTLWGIAKQYGYGESKNNYAAIWSDPRNAGLRSKRGDPKKIQPGDIIYVRKR